MKRLASTLFSLALLSTFANASFYVWADSFSTDISPPSDYNLYVQDVDTTVSDARSITTSFTSASYGSTASLGTLKSYSNVNSQMSFSFALLPRVTTRAQTSDSITNTGSSAITLHFSMPTIGTFVAGSYNATMHADLTAGNLNGTSTLDLTRYEKMINGVYSLDQNVTEGDITVSAGDKIIINSSIFTDARNNVQLAGGLNSGLDFSHTSHLYIDLLTPGGTFTTQSGHNYSSVPEPVSALGLLCGVLLFARRRNR